MAESGSFAANVREREVRKQGENRTDDTLVPPHEYGGRFGSPQLPNRSVRVGRGVEKVRETRRGWNSFRLRREEKAGHRSERAKGDVKSGRGWRRGSAIYPLTCGENQGLADEMNKQQVENKATAATAAWGTPCRGMPGRVEVERGSRVGPAPVVTGATQALGVPKPLPAQSRKRTVSCSRNGRPVLFVLRDATGPGHWRQQATGPATVLPWSSGAGWLCGSSVNRGRFQLPL